MRNKNLKLDAEKLKFRKPFGGDCTRQSQLNRSVDGMVRSQRSKVEGQKSEVIKKLADAGEITGALLLFTALIGCTYLGMAL